VVEHPRHGAAVPFVLVRGAGAARRKYDEAIGNGAYALRCPYSGDLGLWWDGGVHGRGSRFGIYEGITAGQGEEPVIGLRTYAVLLAIVTGAYFIFLLFHKRILNFLERRLAQPLVHRLVASDDARRKALVLGALLLTTGFLLQLFVAMAT
jgi:hypothetical protein